MHRHTHMRIPEEAVRDLMAPEERLGKLGIQKKVSCDCWDKKLLESVKISEDD